MKKLILGVLSAGLIAAPSAFGLSLSLGGGPNGYGPWQTGVGGEFTFQITSPGDQNLIGGYSSSSSGQGGIANSFQTFCVEGNENINSAYPNYTATLNDHSVFSNVQLTKGAAWLYSHFAQGSWSGTGTSYNYGSGRLTSAGLLQQAIWHYMGGQENQHNYDSSNPFEVAAAAFFSGEGNANSAADLTDYQTYHVYVLNMLDSSGKAAQDQLIYSTVVNPNTIVTFDGGMTAMLLGAGFTAVAFVSRRLRRQ